MKTIGITILAGCFLLASLATQSFGQAPMTPIEEGGKMPNKLDKSSVPNSVMEVYIVEYPGVTSESWYGYPAFADESDWYGYNPYMYTSTNPEYYIVEFTKDKTPQKVIYAKTGKKIATHRRSNSVIPKAVANSIAKDYKGWKITQEVEEIFREDDKLKTHYKVSIAKGNEKHTLYYLGDGKLLKDKKMKT